jgi:hypothetical protein
MFIKRLLSNWGNLGILFLLSIDLSLGLSIPSSKVYFFSCTIDKTPFKLNLLNFKLLCFGELICKALNPFSLFY